MSWVYNVRVEVTGCHGYGYGHVVMWWHCCRGVVVLSKGGGIVEGWWGRCRRFRRVVMWWHCCRGS